MNPDQSQPKKELTFEESVASVMQTLPPPIRTYIASGGYTKVAQELMRKYGLHIDQAAILEREMVLMIMGLAAPEEFENTLKSEALLSNEIVQNLMADINKEIFVPLREKMRTGEVQKAVPPAPVKIAPRPPAPPRPAAPAPRYAPPPLPPPPATQSVHAFVPPPVPQQTRPAIPPPSQTPASVQRPAPQPPVNLPGAMPPVSAPVPPPIPPPLRPASSQSAPQVPSQVKSPVPEASAKQKPPLPPPLPRTGGIDPYREPIE